MKDSVRTGLSFRLKAYVPKKSLLSTERLPTREISDNVGYNNIHRSKFKTFLGYFGIYFSAIIWRLLIGVWFFFYHIHSFAELIHRIENIMNVRLFMVYHEKFSYERTRFEWTNSVNYGTRDIMPLNFLTVSFCAFWAICIKKSTGDWPISYMP